MPKGTRSSVKDDILGMQLDDGHVEGLADEPVAVAVPINVQARKDGVHIVSPHDLAGDNSHDGASDILSRYIKNLPDPGRITRSRHAASRLNQENSNYPVKVLASTFQEISSFDSLSTSDYSSNNSTASTTTVKRASGDSFVSAEQSKLTPASDLSCNEGVLDTAETTSHLPAINNARGSYEPEGLARLGHLGWESDDSGEHEKDSGIL